MKIAINGFGRIGRNVMKIAFERDGVDIAAINDITDIPTLAHLLKYDSSFGVYNKKIEAKSDALVVDGKEIKVFALRNPAELPWKTLGVDVVIESTGLFRSAQGPAGGYKDHLKAGASKVILTVPAKDEIDQTIVLGVNDHALDLSSTAFSNASCTTNCLAPVVKILQDSFGVVNGLMTTVHAYTNDQVLLDLPRGDLRRARAAALNIIPTTTGAALAVGKVLPELNGKLNGTSLRVPVPVGSVVDLVVKLKKDVTPEEINQAVKTAAEGSLLGIVEYSEAPLVSSDVKGNPHSAVFDGASTMVMEDSLVKVIAWYDNEFGYSSRVVDLAEKLI